MPHEWNLAKSDVKYSEYPAHPYTITGIDTSNSEEYRDNHDGTHSAIGGELTPDKTHMCTLYMLSKGNSGSIQFSEEIKGIIIRGAEIEPPHKLVSCQFVPLIFIKDEILTDSEGNYYVVEDRDENDHLLSSSLFPMYQLDENGQKQYYNIGREVYPEPGIVYRGVVWSDGRFTREDIIKIMIENEEKYLLDGHRPQHVIEQNIDILGRLIHNDVPTYIPTIPEE